MRSALLYTVWLSEQKLKLRMDLIRQTKCAIFFCSNVSSTKDIFIFIAKSTVHYNKLILNCKEIVLASHQNPFRIPDTELF